MLKIYITTYGRAHKQVTFSKLPPAIQRRTTLVVQAREKHLYTQHPNILVLPPKVQHMASTRQWLIDNHNIAEAGAVALLDDDISFAVRRKDDPTKFQPAADADVVAMFKALEQALKKYAHAGVTPRAGGAWATKPIECGRMLNVLCYDVAEFRAARVRFLRKGERPDVSYSDLDITLQLLRAGHKNIILTDWAIQAAAANAPGGCSTYRTQELMSYSARRVAEHHDPYAKLVIKQAKGAFGGAEREDIKAQWKKAWQSSQKGGK